ncbi:MAG TPA: response regulator [Thermodesulfobacteriota bacterium]|nr:response regulator [Thermodesulfobacteriota bacterium]
MKTILIADEDATTRNLVRLIFTEHKGYKVIATSSGADAVLMATEIVPDIVLVDASLSNQNGYKVSREIKNNPFLKNISIILLTSAFAAFDKRKVSGAYADDVIVKPFEPEEIIKKVESLISRSEKGEVELDSFVQTEEVSKGEGSLSFRSLDKNVVEKKKTNYSESFESNLRLLAKSLKSFYEISKGHVKIFKVIRKLKGRETFLKTVQKTGSFKVSPLHVDKKIYSLFTLWVGIIFRPLVKRLGDSYKGSKGYAEDFKVAVKKIKWKRITSKISIKAGSFKIPSLHLSKRYYLATLVSLGIILPTTMLFVLADMKGVKEKLKLDELLTGAAERNELTLDIKEKETLEGEKVKASQPRKGKASEEHEKVEVREAKKEIPKPREITKEKPKVSKYIVKKGDSLWRIADKFNISVIDLKIANDLKGDRLSIGDPLIIPSGKRKQVLRNEVTKNYVKRRVLAQERGRAEEGFSQPKVVPEDVEDIRRKYMKSYMENLKKTRSELGMSDRGILGPQ